MKSIIQTEKECYVCKTTRQLQLHHVYRGGYRKIADKLGMTVFLCLHHHTGSNEAVHNNKALDLHLKRLGQRKYEEVYGSREDFIETFGRNYLD
jgi:hypothetical protein